MKRTFIDYSIRRSLFERSIYRSDLVLGEMCFIDYLKRLNYHATFRIIPTRRSHHSTRREILTKFFMCAFLLLVVVNVTYMEWCSQYRSGRLEAGELLLLHVDHVCD